MTLYKQFLVSVFILFGGIFSHFQEKAITRQGERDKVKREQLDKQLKKIRNEQYIQEREINSFR